MAGDCHARRVRYLPFTFPEEFILKTIIPTTNEEIKGRELTLSEFYTWFGCRFFIACYVIEFDKRAWWSKKQISMCEGVPHRLNDFIAHNRFEEISRNLQVMDRPTPPFKDGFFLMGQLQEQLNLHYERNYLPSWLSCLDESMSPWSNIYTP